MIRHTLPLALVALLLVPLAAGARDLGALRASLPSEPRAGTLAVDPDGRRGRLVWRVRIDTASPPAAWMATVDAHSGVLLDLTDLRLDAQGHAYEHNPANSDLITVDLTDLEGDEGMDGTYALVRSTVFEGEVSSEAFLAQADGDGDFLYEPDEPSASDPFAGCTPTGTSPRSAVTSRRCTATSSTDRPS